MSLAVAAPVPAAGLLLLLAAGAAAAELPLNGITLGSSVSALAQALGPPANVVSGDSGNAFVFGDDTTAYADDDGMILAVDLRSGSPRVDVDGTPRTFPIGSYSAARADAELADVAEYATPALRSYRVAPRRDLVLGFAQPSNRLDRVAYGEPGQLARLGLLPGDAAAKAVAYRAPRPRRAGGDRAPGGLQSTVYRIAVDRAGNVRSVDVVIASRSPARDAEFAQTLLIGHYAPATLDGRAIAASIFVRVRH